MKSELSEKCVEMEIVSRARLQDLLWNLEIKIASAAKFASLW